MAAAAGKCSAQGEAISHRPEANTTHSSQSAKAIRAAIEIVTTSNPLATESTRALSWRNANSHGEMAHKPSENQLIDIENVLLPSLTHGSASWLLLL